MTRETVKCIHCGLNQFLTDTCRRCKQHPMLVPEPDSYEYFAPLRKRLAAAGRDIHYAFGATILMFRKDAGLSQAQFAKSLGVSRPYVSKIERGLHLPLTRCFWRYFGVLRYSPYFFIRVVESMAECMREERNA